MAHFLLERTAVRPDIDKIRDVIEPAVEAVGYELVDVEYAGRSPSATLRAYIDAPGGITVDDCESVSRQISAVLDVEDPIPGQYTLEVSSPGLNRPLVKPEHFARVVGCKVKLLMRNYHLGRRRFAGVLADVTDTTVAIDVDGEFYELEIADIERARLVPEL